jgi:hypothetical protein
MRVIDSHVHLYPPEVDIDPAGWAELRGERHWALLCTRRRRDGKPVQWLPTIDVLVKAMDAAEIERAVLLGWYWEKPETCVWQNRFYAESVRLFPERLSAFATIHPRAGREATLEEVRRAQGEGLIGIGELSPHSQGYPVDDPVFGEVLTLAAELKMPVNLHAADPDTRRYPGWVETPAKDFVWLARMFPRTTFVLAHWGGMLALRDTRLAEQENVFFDTAASPLLYGEKVWSHALPALGSGRVLFGSDFPLNLYPRVAVEAEMRRFVIEARRAGAGEDVLSGNAARLFSL